MEKKQNVPALRFPGFSGEWKKKRLEEMGASFSYGLNAAATTYDGQHKYLRITDIDDESRKFSGKELTSPNVDLSNASDYLDYKLQENDIVFARTGASVGKTYLYDTSDGDVYYAGFLIRVKIDSKYDANFIFQKTLTSDYSHFVVVTSQRSGQPGINAQEYANWEMLVPELNEQKKIGRFLTDFDKNIFVCREKIKKLQQFRQAMLAKLFPREGAAEPELRFRGFSGKWKLRRLSDFVKEVTRVDASSHAPVMMITAANGFINQSERYSFDNSGQSLQKYILLKQGELAYNHGASKLRPFGSCFVLREKEARVPFVYHCFSVTDNYADFVALELNGNLVERQLRRIVSSGARMDGLLNISFEEYCTVKIALPCQEEQRKIGNFFRNLDTYISLQQKKLERMQRLKAALLEKLFV